MQLEITDDLLLQVKSMGMLAYSPADTARALGISREVMDEHLANEESPIFGAYWGGFYETDIALRDSIFKLAKAGSSPAQKMAMDYIQLSQLNNRML